MKERLYRVLNIKDSESSQVFDLLTVQFFIGLANAIFNVIALTLFVYNFSIDSLPLVYLTVAGMLILCNFIYEKLEHKFSPLHLLRYVIGFAAVLMTVIWTGLTYGNTHDFIFILLVSSVLIYMVTGYAFWGLVSLLFNIRESRRVFSIVGSGDIPAKMIGYIAGPLLISFVGINNMIWFSILSLATGFILFGQFIKKKSWNAIKKHHSERYEADHDHKPQSLVKFFFENKLIFAISLLSILSYNVFVLVDYTFISQVKLSFENIADLAAYIAIFFAFGRVIALAFKLIFTSRVIERLGVVNCLFITPVALFLFCLLFFMIRDKSDYNLFIFGLMALLTEVLRSTMQEPVFFILFQPLKENLRLKGHIISKGYMYPPSLIVVGLSLIFVRYSGIEVTILQVIKVVIINLGVWVAIIFFIRRTYLSTVHDSIKKGIFNSDDIYITDQKTIDILLSKIDSGKKIEVIYSLDLLEKSGYAGFGELLQKQLVEGQDIEVKKYALERSEATGKVNIDILRNMLGGAKDAELEQKIISLLCKHDPEFLNSISEDIRSLGAGLRKTIIISLLNHREFNYLFKAGNEINRLLHSRDATERELAVEIISELKNVQFSDAIATLINDKAVAVRRVAITAACKLRMKQLLPSIFKLLDQPEHKNIVLKGLTVYGDQLFNDMRDLSIVIPEECVTDFIKIAGKSKGKHSTDFLISKMNDKHVFLKDKVMHALWLKEYLPSGGSEKDNFSMLLRDYLQAGLSKIKDYSGIPDFNDRALIRRSIFNEVKNDLVIALKICSLLFGKKEINRIIELMENGKQDKLYNGMEMLELLLPKKISTELNILFDFILDPNHHASVGSRQEIKTFYTKVIFNDPHLYNPWTKAVCVYSSWKNNDVHFLRKLKDDNTRDEDYLVRETKEYVLHAIK